MEATEFYYPHRDSSQPPMSIQEIVDLIANEEAVVVSGSSNSGNLPGWQDIAGCELLRHPRVRSA